MRITFFFECWIMLYSRLKKNQITEVMRDRLWEYANIKGKKEPIKNGLIFWLRNASEGYFRVPSLQNVAHWEVACRRFKDVQKDNSWDFTLHIVRNAFVERHLFLLTLLFICTARPLWRRESLHRSWTVKRPTGSGFQARNMMCVT